MEDSKSSDQSCSTCFLFQVFLVWFHCCLGEKKKFSFLFHLILRNCQTHFDTSMDWNSRDHKEKYTFSAKSLFFSVRGELILFAETAFVLLRCIILALDESWETKAFNFLSQPSDLVRNHSLHHRAFLLHLQEQPWLFLYLPFSFEEFHTFLCRYCFTKGFVLRNCSYIFLTVTFVFEQFSSPPEAVVKLLLHKL